MEENHPYFSIILFRGKVTFMLGYIYIYIYVYFPPKTIFFPRSCSTGKFPGQGSNLSHSSNPSHSSGNAVFLTTRPPMHFWWSEREIKTAY